MQIICSLFLFLDFPFALQHQCRFLPNTHLHHVVFFPTPPLPSVLFPFLLFSSTLFLRGSFPNLLWCALFSSSFTPKLSRTNLSTAHISSKIKLNHRLFESFDILFSKGFIYFPLYISTFMFPSPKTKIGRVRFP